MVPQKILRGVFGEKYWNENFTCVPVNKITDGEYVLLKFVFLKYGIVCDEDVSFLIGE